MSATRTTSASVSPKIAEVIAVEAYVYLYPLVTMEVTRRQMTNLPAGERPGFAPMDSFSHVRQFPPADFKAVVRPNFDTLYSTAWLDLTEEPRVISVPDTDGRYYLLPLYDMWTEAFAVPGTRTSGTSGGSYAVVGPGWRGALPDGVEAIQAPTSYVWIIGRTQANGPREYEAVHAVQDGLAIAPLSRWPDGVSPVNAAIDSSVDMQTAPLEQVNGMPGADYFALASELMRLHPPHLTDWSILARMRHIGLRSDDLRFDELGPTVQDALQQAPGRALELMREKLPTLARVTNGWVMNTDTMGVYGNYYLKRAIVAMVGLGANQPEDAIYPLNVSDRDGEPLDGANDYVLHFAQADLPPVEAFWSVTMYDADGFQADNPINRFAIGDRDELRYNADGSLDLYLQHEHPGEDKEANWLPAPLGPLGVTMRLYAPKPQVLDGRWNPPAITRADRQRN
jgi:hypothetical protein